ncbi:ThuA domain-containing protein [Kitasatospora terrestris]|uniref:Lectin n=1 Tax=Kitasatospora terrestris TaxID=258051 RepID=A0ABP9DAH9_9ACTN
MPRSRSLMGALALCSALALTTPAHAAEAAPAPYKVLVFSKAAGYVHDSIPTAVQTVKDLGAANGFTVDATADDTVFTDADLAQYKAVVFVSTTGDFLPDPDEQAAFERYIRAGGGYAGIHAAADGEYQWPFYGKLVGAWFRGHPSQQNARVTFEDRGNASTSHLPSTPWTRWDEWYNYQTNPRANTHVLASLDETSYQGGTMGGDHPITWCQDFAGGRSWYTGMGHTTASYTDPAFRAMLLGGIQYAAGTVHADCRPETGYTPLYNGDATGWTQAGPGGFDNSDATLSTRGGMGLYWRSTQLPSNRYSLKLDWKMQGDDNSGVYVGFPDPHGDPAVAVSKGYEIQLDATDTPARSTGSVYNFRAPDAAARDAALNAPGMWNTYEIVVDAPRIQVYLNGVKINDFTGDPARFTGTNIGLQNLSDSNHVSFRNVRVKSLDAVPTGPQAGRTYTLTSVASNKVADVAGASTADDAKVVQWPAAGSANQKWKLTDTGDGTYTLTAAHSGKCLDIPAGGTATNGTKLDQTTCTGGANQKWDLRPAGPLDQDTYLLTSAASGKCLDVPGATLTSGTQLQQWSCSGNPAQQWKLTQLD